MNRPNFLRQHPARAPIAALMAVLLAHPALAGLAEDVRGIVSRAGLRDAAIAVSVRDADSDRVLVAIDADRPLIPASNMKVLTSGTALATLGRDFVFRTQLRSGPGSGAAPGRDVTLAVVGDGDPALADPDLLAKTTWTDATGEPRVGMTSEQLVGLWVAAVRKAGIESVKELVVDDRVFARERFHPAWPREQLNQRSFAEVAGLNFQTNLLQFLPRVGGGPRPDISDIRPRSPWISVENKATTRSGRQDKQTVWITRDDDSNAFSVRGNVKFNVADPIEVPLHDPPGFFGRLLADRLRAAGVAVATARVAGPDDPRFGDPAEPWGTAVGPAIQTPIAAVLERCNTDSQNLYAEALLKRSGHKASGEPGSWSNGAAAVRAALAARLSDASLARDLVVSDGSGLSRQNRVTAALVTAWLNTFHRDGRLAATFVDSLAVGGENGTLRNRFGKLENSGVTVQCKTGYINGVSCLSGFVTTSDGRRRSFSVLGNNLIQPGAVAKAKKLQESIVEAIAEEMRGVAVLGGN